MADHQTAGRSAEAPVGDQRHRLAQTAPYQCGGDAEHLAHSGSAAGSLVTDDHHVAGLDPSVPDRREGVFLAIEDARRTAVPGPLVSRNFHHRSVGSEAPAEDDETTVR